MIKKSLICICILLCSVLIGCDQNNEYNVKISSSQYINTSETITVNGYNGYKLIESNQVVNEDGSISVSLKFSKPIK